MNILVCLSSKHYATIKNAVSILNEIEERSREGSRGESRKEEKSRISSRRSLFRGCDYRCLWGSRVSTRSSFSPRPSICLALQTWRSIIPRLRCNEISRGIRMRWHTRRRWPPHCRARVPLWYRGPLFSKAWIARVCVDKMSTCVENTPQGLAARSRNNYPEGLAFIRNYTMCRVYHCDLRWLTEKGYGETGIKGTKDARHVNLTHTPRWAANVNTSQTTRKLVMVIRWLRSFLLPPLLPPMTVIFDGSNSAVKCVCYKTVTRLYIPISIAQNTRDS